MANEEHVRILKQGVEVWNSWRLAHFALRPMLRGADLRHLKLTRIDFSMADLSETNLSETNLSMAYLAYANLSDANLSRADLTLADLEGALLRDSNLSWARLLNADLREVDLSGANLSWADLSHANLTGCTIGQVTFGGNDLSTIKGLDSARHMGPSSLGIDTLNKSRGKLPTGFLKGCGLSDWQIESAKLYKENLNSEEFIDILYSIQATHAHKPIQVNPLFISYSHKDTNFVDKMQTHLDKNGIRCWRDIHDSTAGPLEKQIDRAIRLNPTVLLVLSANSIQSDWVQHEVRLARELQLETRRDTLCPVALDDSWRKTCDWPKRLLEQLMEYNILDFSLHKDEGEFRRMFARLIKGLDLFYK